MTTTLDFSISPLWTFRAGPFFVVGAVLCLAGFSKCVCVSGVCLGPHSLDARGTSQFHQPKMLLDIATCSLPLAVVRTTIVKCKV